MVRFLSLALLGLSLSVAAEEFPIPPEAIKALRAADDHALYGVIALERRTEGKRQVVFLMGESHSKTADASRLGKDVLATFPGVIGVEGIGGNVHKYVLGNFFKKRILPILHSLIPFSHGSTIYDAQARAEGEEGPVVISLEDGHEPDLLENATFVYLTSLITYSGARLTYSAGNAVIHTIRMGPAEYWRSLWAKKEKESINPCESTFSAIVRRAPQILRFSIYGGSAYVFGGNGYSYYNPEATWGIIGNRNETMAGNILKQLDREKDEPVLVVAGAAHLRGIEAMLKKAGFSRVAWRE